MKGRKKPPRSEEWKENRRLQMKKKWEDSNSKYNSEGRNEKLSEYMKNGGSTYANSFQTEESRRKQAEKISGLNNSRWNPNREQVFAPYTEEFEINKTKVRKRDKYICNLCFKRGKTVHHIDENKQESSLGNMITLCHSCHTKIHSKDKGIWVIFYQPYFRCIVNKVQNKILALEQAEDIQEVLRS
jgi:hypothetical protein